MAWSPFQRANAGIIGVEQPGDYANPIPTTSATGPNTDLYVTAYITRYLPLNHAASQKIRADVMAENENICHEYSVLRISREDAALRSGRGGGRFWGASWRESRSGGFF
jgi:hypothetical protein